MVEMGDVRRLARDVDPGLLEAEVKYAYIFAPVREDKMHMFTSAAEMMMDEEMAFGFEERRLTVELVAGAALEFAHFLQAETWAIAYLMDGRVVRIRASEREVRVEPP